MGNEILVSVIFAVIAIAIGAAWVGGYLDAYQSKAQEKVLDAMGENKASYGLKSMLTCYHGTNAPGPLRLECRALTSSQVISNRPRSQRTRTSTSCRITWLMV